MAAANNKSCLMIEYELTFEYEYHLMGLSAVILIVKFICNVE